MINIADKYGLRDIMNGTLYSNDVIDTVHY